MKRLVLLSIILFTCLLISLTTQAQVTVQSISSDNQIGAAGYPLPKPFLIKVEKNGIRLTDHPVEFSVISGNGSLTITNARTDERGEVKSILILGPDAGTNTVEVKVNINGSSHTKIMQATGIRPVTDMFDRISGSTPNIWRKFIGEQVPDGTPDLIDHSYAGYKTAYHKC